MSDFIEELMKTQAHDFLFHTLRVAILEGNFEVIDRPGEEDNGASCFSWVIKESSLDSPGVGFVFRTGDDSHTMLAVHFSGDGFSIEHLMDVAESMPLIESNSPSAVIDLIDEHHGDKVDIDLARRKIKDFRDRV